MANKGIIVEEFIPGKAYLIKGKSIKQVKKEIKKWLSKNEVEIVKDEGNEIQGYRLDFFKINSMGIWLHLKLSATISGTLIIYDNRLFRTEIIPIHWPFINTYLEELRKDLIRYLQGRPELIVGYFDKLITKVNLISFIPFFLGILIMFIGPKIVGPYWNKIIIIFILLYLILNLLFGHYLLGKLQKLSNLPEYRVEEYTGKIDLDQ
ncbi:MAG: hypothetical protein GYA51_12095 [Candidatus Methanofastidiosa archaeon]|nr:hypothetical protein [Candidatus Methanofastidiosa archaeon]